MVVRLFEFMPVNSRTDEVFWYRRQTETRIESKPQSLVNVTYHRLRLQTTEKAYGGPASDRMGCRKRPYLRIGRPECVELRALAVPNC